MKIDIAKKCSIQDLVGKTLVKIWVSGDNDVITFITDEGEHYQLYHDQDCCESVTIDSIVGDLHDLLGSPILVAEEATSRGIPQDLSQKDVVWYDSFTWTFYKFATIKGYVDIRWYGESNGCYSESVNFEKVEV